MCWKNKGVYNKAIDFYDKALNIDSNNWTVLYHKSLILFEMDPSSAIEYLTLAEQTNDLELKSLIYELRARCYGMLGLYEKSLTDFERALHHFQEKDIITVQLLMKIWVF